MKIKIFLLMSILTLFGYSAIGQNTIEGRLNIIGGFTDVVDVGTFSNTFTKSWITSSSIIQPTLSPANLSFTITAKMDISIDCNFNQPSSTFRLFLSKPNGATVQLASDNNKSSLYIYNLEPGTYIICTLRDYMTVIRGYNFAAGYQPGNFTIGNKSNPFTYTDTRDTGLFTNTFGTGSGDLTYKLILDKSMDITISHCGSIITDTYLWLLDSDKQTIIAHNNDYTGAGACSNTKHAYISIKNLKGGTYYIVSEGNNMSGKLTTTVIGVCEPSLYSTSGIYSTDQNFIATRTITSEDGTKFIDEAQYFDGLGRPMQRTQVGVTPTGKDLVAIQEYDAMGRESNTWLPAAIAENKGRFVTPTLVMNTARTTNTNATATGVASDFKPYKAIYYEPSPLDRVQKTVDVGQKWHDANSFIGIGGRGMGMEYISNAETGAELSCPIISVSNNRTDVTITKGANFSRDQLFVTKITDEEGNISYEFKNKLGQVILTRQYDGNEYLSTYYVYDIYGNLRAVLPPEIAGDASWGSALDPNTRVSKFAYIYQYDYRNRCISKKLPGVEKVCFVYDMADHLILSQDGEQRSRNEWTFSIPDHLGRVVLTGVCKNNIDYLATKPLNTVVKARQEILNDKDYNITGITLLYAMFHTANYYDSYSFMGSYGILQKTGYTAETVPDYGVPSTGSCKGMLTGTWNAMLDNPSSEGVYSVMYYDKKGRLVQTKSNNHLTAGVINEYLALNMMGQVTKSKQTYVDAGTTTLSEQYDYEYDHVNRLRKTFYSLNGKESIILADNNYDELGRLASIKRNGDPKLTSNYTYNVRSWTTSIQGNLFKQNIDYTNHFNGNISNMSWWASTDAAWGTYKYSYDKLSRLSSAGYLENGMDMSNYGSSYAYDRHGNIKELLRGGIVNAGGGYDVVDRLTMTLDGNQVTRVTDAGRNSVIAESADFQDITKGAGQYTYNRNGAINKDTHRGVSNIRYNSLNLPEEVTVGNIEGSGSIKYSYSGTGTKLSTQHTNNTYPAKSKTTTYVGNLVYENGALKRVLVEGGYVEGGVHHFFLEDYLGNVRVVANAGGAVVQKNAYYPFGMAFAGSPGGAAGGVGASAADQAKQPYKFGGKELDQAFGLDQYDFSARYYDPATARFTSQDPLAEKYYSTSPYAYCSNNPIKYIDPTGMNLDWYFNLQGTYLGRDDKKTDNIMIVHVNSDISRNFNPSSAEVITKSIEQVSLSNSAIEKITRFANILTNPAEAFSPSFKITAADLKDSPTVMLLTEKYNPVTKGKIHGQTPTLTVNSQEGKVHPLLNTMSNLQNTIIHEKGHRNDGVSLYNATNNNITKKQHNARRELNAIGVQRAHPTYLKTTPAYQKNVNDYEKQSKDLLGLP